MKIYKNLTPRPLHFETGISTLKMAAKFETFTFYRVHPGLNLCNLCGKNFNQSDSFKEHVNLCGKNFNQSDSLKEHVRRIQECTINTSDQKIIVGRTKSRVFTIPRDAGLKIEI